MLVDFSTMSRSPEEVCQTYLKAFNQKFGTSAKFSPKEKSWVMKVLSYILFFNRDFMKGYVTTLNETIFVPETFWDKPEHGWWNNLHVAYHESLHIFDKKTWGVLLFSLTYLCPQAVLTPLGLVTTLALGAPWWVVLIATTVPILPVVSVAPFRVWWEIRGYRADILFYKTLFSDDITEIVDRILEKFTGPDYFWMGTLLKGWVKKKLLDVNGSWTQAREYQFMFEFLRNQGLARDPS